MSLVSEYGRVVRAEVVDRAKQIKRGASCSWQAALTQAYAEARAEIEARKPVPTVTARPAA